MPIRFHPDCGHENENENENDGHDGDGHDIGDGHGDGHTHNEKNQNTHTTTLYSFKIILMNHNARCKDFLTQKFLKAYSKVAAHLLAGTVVLLCYCYFFYYCSVVIVLLLFPTGCCPFAGWYCCGEGMGSGLCAMDPADCP